MGRDHLDVDLGYHFPAEPSRWLPLWDARSGAAPIASLVKDRFLPPGGPFEVRIGAEIDPTTLDLGVRFICGSGPVAGTRELVAERRCGSEPGCTPASVVRFRPSAPLRPYARCTAVVDRNLTSPAGRPIAILLPMPFRTISTANATLRANFPGEDASFDRLERLLEERTWLDGGYHEKPDVIVPFIANALLVDSDWPLRAAPERTRRAILRALYVAALHDRFPYYWDRTGPKGTFIVLHYRDLEAIRATAEDGAVASGSSPLSPVVDESGAVTGVRLSREALDAATSEPRFHRTAFANNLGARYGGFVSHGHIRLPEYKLLKALDAFGDRLDAALAAGERSPIPARGSLGPPCDRGRFFAEDLMCCLAATEPKAFSDDLIILLGLWMMARLNGGIAVDGSEGGGPLSPGIVCAPSPPGGL